MVCFLSKRKRERERERERDKVRVQLCMRKAFSPSFSSDYLLYIYRFSLNERSVGWHTIIPRNLINAFKPILYCTNEENCVMKVREYKEVGERAELHPAQPAAAFEVVARERAKAVMHR